VDRDAVLGQLPKSWQHRVEPFVAENAAAQGIIGGVHRHVQGRQPLFDNPLVIGVIHRRQRDEIPVRKREPVIVVLVIERATHTLGLLVDKTEDAVVLADLDLPLLELQAQVAAGLVVDQEPVDLVVARNLQLQPVIGGMEPVVDNILDRLAVDRAQDISFADIPEKRRISVNVDYFHIRYFRRIQKARRGGP
jgi:hypothetical protein